MKSKREPYVTPVLVRHGGLEELTGQQKGTQGTTDKSSTPPI
jgi:hypothetical protein